MEQISTVDTILDFAIEQEQKAYDLYASMAEQATNAQTRDILMGMAAEETGHKQHLQRVKSGVKELSIGKQPPELSIGKYLPETKLSPNMTFNQAVEFAILAEKAAYELYMDIAASTFYAPFHDLFIALAQQEQAHQARFEAIYSAN
jgi:rubrerythrin